MTRALPLLLVLSLLLAALGACAPSAQSEWLEAARGAQLDGGDARATLEAFLAAPVPEGLHPVDARVVRQDVAYQLARLLLTDGDAEGAERVASEALAEGQARDVFTANLFVVRGQALEVAGNPVRATLDYHEALLINEALLEAALADEGTEEEDE